MRTATKKVLHDTEQRLMVTHMVRKRMPNPAGGTYIPGEAVDASAWPNLRSLENVRYIVQIHGDGYEACACGRAFAIDSAMHDHGCTAQKDAG